MRVLLDTNIIIDREGEIPVPPEVQEFLRQSQELAWMIVVHPLSRTELMRDLNELRREKQLSKIAAYPLLSQPPNPRTDASFMQLMGTPSSPNDEVDIALLFAVKADAVDFLITNDQGIHRKAKRCNIESRVLTSDDAVTIIRTQRVDYSLTSPPSIVLTPVHNLDLEDPIFEELKSDYPTFDDWWAKISREGREAWIYQRDDDSLGAVLILKVEDGNIDCDQPFPQNKRVKICTLVVTYTGYRIGELFIKLAVEFCVKNRIDEIYLTHFTKEKDYLVNLISEYGFSKICEKHEYGKPEEVFLKKLTFTGSIENRELAWDIASKYYPSFYCGSHVSKYLVPIRPDYHERLFLGFKQQLTLPEILGELEIPGNTIDKAYLCNSIIRRIEPGDILLFYRSQDYQQITTVAIIEEVHQGRINSQKAQQLLGKRTVLSIPEIEEVTRRDSLILLFRSLLHFPDPIDLSTLIENNLIRSAPQQIMGIDENAFEYIMKESGIDSRYLVN